MVPLSAAVVVVAALWCSGCAPTGDVPRDRFGSLPFPGPATLYSTADPARLGPHRYAARPGLFGADEIERGIIYTTRAGFLDLAHVRIAIDWTRFCTLRVRDALAAGRTALPLPGTDKSVFHVTLHYPAGWSAMPAAERAALADAAAQRIGQRVAFQVLTWHEVTTWFGFRTFFVDESPSSFTYDDTVAHLVGMRVARRAMAGAGRGFDEAAAAALDAELRRLGAVSPAQTEQAVRAVEGVWWYANRPLKRQTHVYPGGDEVVYPWLVPGLPFGTGTPPESFPLPPVDGVSGGRDAGVTATVEIEPRIMEARLMRRLLPGEPQRFREDRDLPVLLRAVRAQMREQYGPEVEQPRSGS